MIISANETNDFISLLYKESQHDPFACRIISLYNSYAQTLAFVDYWMIADDSYGKFTGAIARSGSAFILFLTRDCNIDEVSSFMRVAGASSIICSADYQIDLLGSSQTTGSILMKKTPIVFPESNIEFVQPKIEEAYDLLVKCADENFNPPRFEDYYVDVNHKLRHGTMRICGAYEKNTLASVAMTVAECDNGAVLGAVACHPDFRKQGYGSSTVKYITNQLISERKTVYLHRAKNANITFYDNLGFNETGQWSEYTLSR